MLKKFSELELPEELSAALEKIDFVETTPIQSQAIPLLVQGKDLIACSETGSGKTAAYALPILMHLFENEKQSGLILAPTRELAQQINEFVDQLVIKKKNFNVVRLVGGTDIRKQFKKLQKKPRLIVATPGRLIDHLKRNTVQIHNTNYLVLDEGDRMIDMGFAPQLKQILKHLPEKRQTSFFTATLDKKVTQLANEYLTKPAKITIGTASRPVASIRQDVIQVEFKDKDECIVNELNSRDGSVIIFSRTKYRTDRLTSYLAEYGFSVEQIHGGRTQGQRNKAIRNFKAGKIRILCATDVAARGIDVPHVEHVINFDLPMMAEDYVHRIGRTARNGAEGEAVSFVTPQEHRYWNKLVKTYSIPEALLPEAPYEPKKNSKGQRRGRKGGGSSRGADKRRGKKAGARSGRAGDEPRRKKRSDRFNDEDKPLRKSSKSYSKKSDRFNDEDKPRRKSAKSFSRKSSKKVSVKSSKKKKTSFKKSGGFKKSRSKQGARRAARR